MNVNTTQCLTYLHGGLTLDPCWSLLKAPVLSTLYNNILELDITVVQESKSLLNDILMNLENIKRLTLTSVSSLSNLRVKFWSLTKHLLNTCIFMILLEMFASVPSSDRV